MFFLYEYLDAAWNAIVPSPDDIKTVYTKVLEKIESDVSMKW